jgi:hypothetical protein
MLSIIGVNNQTSSLNQLGGAGGIRFLGSAKGALPIGPAGIPAFNSLDTEGNPFETLAIRNGMVSYNYTLSQQGLEAVVSCLRSEGSPVSSYAIEGLNSTLLVSTNGTCDEDGLQQVLTNVTDYPTLNVDNSLAYWACKESPSQDPLHPTYFVYLRGRANYRDSLGNITCRISPMRARDLDVAYHSLPGSFTSRATTTLGDASQRPTFSPFTDWLLVGLGNLIWEGQNWSSNLFAEAVLSMGAKNLNISSFEPSDEHLRLFEALIQGVLEYEVSLT